jgi:hypothetical protein
MVSTYQSFSRLQNIPKIDIACMDEAHTVVEEKKFDDVKAILDKKIIDRIFYFTATPVHGCNGRGMDNSNVFGPKLIGKTPKEAIDQGYILPPVIHKVAITGKRTLSAVIKGAYTEHRKKIQKISGKNSVARLLVSVKGIDEMIKLVTKESFKDWAKGLGISVVAFSSRPAYFMNGFDISRKEALDTIRELSKEDKPFILLHYDILTEGIDLPNLTGVLIDRELDPVKFIQTCGRAARLTKSDRELLKQGIKSTIGKDGVVELNRAMEKPCYWVIDTESNPTASKELVERIRKEYELQPFFKDFSEISTSKSIDEIDAPYPPELNDKEKEAQTILTQKFELYRLQALVKPTLLKEDQNKGIEQILKELNKVLDNLLEKSKGVSNGEIKISGNNPAETSVPQIDTVITSKSGTDCSITGHKSYAELLDF